MAARACAGGQIFAAIARRDSTSTGSQVPGPRRNALHRWTVISRSVHEQPFRGIVTTPMADGERL
jgi:hypothetical protein